MNQSPETQRSGSEPADSYRTGTIKRRRRTNAEVGQLDRQIIAVLEQDYPQSVRHVFYRMTDPRLPEPVEKSDRGYRHVQDRCVKLRRSGKLPYGWIADATRRGYFVNTYGSAGEFLHRVAGLYRADLWDGCATYVEVWTESRSIAGVIQADCRELAVSLYPAGGFSSITLAYESATEINNEVLETYSFGEHFVEDVRPNKNVVIFYIGDFDPAGVLIDVALERELRQHLHSDIRLDFRRLAITAEQIAEYDLPTKPRKEGDKRARHVESTVEAEAMPAHILRGLLRAGIEALLPVGALAAAKAAEESERAHLRRMAHVLRGGDA
jgi:hypothetical protein